MDELSRVYESARLNIPLRAFPERRSVPPWEELDEGVRERLLELNANVLSVVRGGSRVLQSSQRVIHEFNRGVRSGFLASTGTDPGSDATRPLPFLAGLEVGRRARAQAHPDMGRVKQFITATHLLAYEFGQLDHALRAPFEFLLHNLSPERADELGELAFALPVLLNQQRERVLRVLEDPGFSFARYYDEVSPAPSHEEYLSLGVVALLDAEPSSWQRVGAALGLATTPFLESQGPQGGRTAVPEQAARTILNRPMAAHRAVRRQMERIELARTAAGEVTPGLELDGFEHHDRQATLWDVYQMTAASRIRSGEYYFADLVASMVIAIASRHLDAVRLSGQSRLRHYRCHFLAFVRGFDARHEGVVDPSALDSVALGRALSDGLRRFEGGGLLIGAVSRDLAETARMINSIHHAHRNPVANVVHQLRRIRETPVADCLLELFEVHPGLARDLFEPSGRLSLYAQTDIQVFSPYDLMRSALYRVLRSVDRERETEDERHALREGARNQLSLLISSVEELQRSPQRTRRSEAALRRDLQLLEAARLFERNFHTLVRLMEQVCSPLYLARVLSAPRGGVADGPTEVSATRLGRASA